MRNLLVAAVAWVGVLGLGSGAWGQGTTSSSSATTRYAGAATRGSVVREEPPGAPREFRGVWVSSVNNGTWPSRAGESAAEAKGEMIAMLDRCVELKVNAVVLQVRPCADALYASELEPWSEYLTGVQGKAPEPMWDPLAVWIEECHKRGMELHAWFNPYRVKVIRGEGGRRRGRGAATQATTAASVALGTDAKTQATPDAVDGNAPASRPADFGLDAKSIGKTHPEVVRRYGNLLWMDPGEAVAEKQTLDVILDIVRRYDVDGVHTDDYYYPYKVRGADGKEVDFPDDASYGRYTAGGGKLGREDWRRENVNRLVEKIYSGVHAIKPWVKVGYAPFGIWKAGTPEGIKGLSMYDALYADAKLWLNKGWCDYMSPQLYWKIGGDQDYAKLLKWWVSENTAGRAVWPGLSVGRHPVDMVEEQVAMTRADGGSSAGVILWSVNSVLRRRELFDALKGGLYEQGALVPEMGWKKNGGEAAPGAPVVVARRGEGGRVRVSIVAGDGGARPAVYGVWARYGEGWRFEVAAAEGAPGVTLEPRGGAGASAVVVSAVDRFGVEGRRVRVGVE